MTTHSSILAWKIPWTEKPGGLQCMRSKRVIQLSTHTHTHTHTGLKSFLSFLVSGEISPVFSCFFNLTSCPCHQVSVQILLQVGLHELRLIPQVWAYLCRVYKDLTVPHTNLGECSPGLEKPLQNQYIC